jgi:hypothetical protein
LPKTDATWQEKLMPKADRRLIQLLFTSFNWRDVGLHVFAT